MPTPRFLPLLLLACLLPAQAQESAPTSFDSRKEAQYWLLWASDQKAAIEARYAHDEWACYDKFFVNHCVDQVRETRRNALAQINPVEINANRYLRKLDYQEHIQDLDEKNQAKDAQIKARQTDKK